MFAVLSSVVFVGLFESRRPESPSISFFFFYLGRVQYRYGTLGVWRVGVSIGQTASVPSVPDQSSGRGGPWCGGLGLPLRLAPLFVWGLLATGPQDW